MTKENRAAYQKVLDALEHLDKHGGKIPESIGTLCSQLHGEISLLVSKKEKDEG